MPFFELDAKELAELPPKEASVVPGRRVVVEDPPLGTTDELPFDGPTAVLDPSMAEEEPRPPEAVEVAGKGMTEEGPRPPEAVEVAGKEMSEELLVKGALAVPTIDGMGDPEAEPVGAGMFVRLANGTVAPSRITFDDESRDSVSLPMVMAPLGRMVLEPMTTIEESWTAAVMLPKRVTVPVVQVVVEIWFVVEDGSTLPLP